MLLRVAVMAGEWNINSLSQRMDVKTLATWTAYYRISPWGDDWRRSGRLASVIASAAGVRVDGDFEDKFMPGGGRYRGMNQTEREMMEELKKIPQMREQFEQRR